MLRKWDFEIQLDEGAGKALYLRIADAIINDIQSGRLKGGDALPGSRNLAQLLNVNRNTIVEALNVLITEGWLVARERQGTFVADTCPDFKNTSLSANGAQTFSQADGQHFHLEIDDGHPNSRIAPITELARAYRQIFNQKARWQMMGYGHELGDAEFRRTVVQMLNHQRGMQVSEDHICITRGSQMAMYLTAQCLLTGEDHVMIENPGYQPAWAAFESTGARLLPVGVDEEGILIDEVRAHLASGKRIKAIYVTPHHQYPTTVTLSLKRRWELIQLSNEYGVTIIEDDYDNEFHFGYRPILPLSSFTELKNYVYIGTMSKVVAPALRIGYLVSRDISLVRQVGDLRKIIDIQGDSMMEQAVLQLIKDGTIKRHIKKATQHYKAKRDFTAGVLEKYMKNRASFNVPEGGLAFWLEPARPVAWTQVAKKLRVKGIKIFTPDIYSFEDTVNGIRLGYGSLSEQELEEGIRALAQMLR